MSEDTLDIQFPLKGIDVSVEYGKQRPGTTAEATNVRALDPLQERLRGGSRHGLEKYPAGAIPDAENAFVQTLEVSGGVDTTINWQAPGDITGTMSVEMWAPGGCPPSNDPGATSGANGGGGGGYARLTAFTPTALQTYVVVIGTGDNPANTDGSNTTFNGTSCIAVGGKANGTGGTGSTGDVTYAGGAGGTSGVGLGGAGGGGGAGDGGAGGVGQNGQATNTGGTGGAAGAGSNPGGAGGAGATGDPGVEVNATPGATPGAGGGGGACDTGGDPASLLSAIAGDGKVILRYNTLSPIQNLNQIVLLNADNLNSSFEYYSPDFIPDPSTNNLTTRNPGRSIPPIGSGSQPNRNRPLAVRRRIQLVPSPTIQFNGSDAILTATLTARPGGSAVGSGSVTLYANPKTSDGYGDVGTTNGSGIATFTVNEPSYEGTVSYTSVHEYTDSLTGRPVVATAFAQVIWKPAYALALDSPDGNTLDVSSGTHPLLATLTRISTGAAVGGRRISLRTTGAGRFGDKAIRVTDGSGIATFTIQSPVPESIDYTATLVPTTSGSPATISQVETVLWVEPAQPPLEPFPPNPPPSPPAPAIAVTWVVESATYYNTIQGKDRFIYSVRRYENGVATGLPFTLLETTGTNVLCCLPAIRSYGGPGIPGFTGYGASNVATMYGVPCPTTVLANDAYVLANCVGL